MSKKKAFNPFYPLLMILGVVFAVTASAYGVMTVKMSTAEGISASAGSWLMEFMSDYGLITLGVQLVLLALASLAAMATDNYWTGRESQEPPHDSHG